MFALRISYSKVFKLKKNIEKLHTLCNYHSSCVIILVQISMAVFFSGATYMDKLNLVRAIFIFCILV